MGSLYKLVLKTNIKGPALAFPLIMPLIFVLLYSVMMKAGQDQEMVNLAVATFYTTILSMTTMQSGLMGFGINFITIKKSVLLRRIGATELSKMDVILAMILFGLTLYLISFVWIFIAMIIFTAMGTFYSAAGVYMENGIPVSQTFETVTAEISGWISNIHWGKLILVTLLMLFTSYSIGMFFTTIAKDDQAYMGIAMMYFFFAGFFGGLMMPGAQPDWMNYVGYIVPHGYLDPLYDWTTQSGWGLGDVSTVDYSLGFIIPIIVGFAAIFGAAKLLKFD